MLLAVLRRAVWDFAQYKDPDNPSHELHIDAAGWLFWDGEEHMSFHYICHSLDLHPMEIRQAAAKLTRDSIKRISQRIESEV